MFRSKDMCLTQLMFAQESMWDTMNHLANTEKAMFAPPLHHKVKTSNSMTLYANKMIKQTEEFLNFAREIELKMREFNWPVAGYSKEPRDYVREIDRYCYNNGIESSKLFERVEVELMNKHALITEYFTNFTHILEQRVNLLEKQMALGVIDELVPFELNGIGENDSRSGNSVKQRGFRSEKKFHTVLGFIPNENLYKLQKLLFRISRENIMLKSKGLDEITDPLLKEKLQPVRKTLIFILFPRTEKEVIIQKVDSILKYFDFTSMDTPQSNNKQDVIIQYREKLDDNRKILERTLGEINTILEEFSRPRILNRLSYINVIKLILKREQNFAQNLIFIEEKDGFYQLLVWVPVSSIDQLHQDLDEIRMSDPMFTKPKLIEIGQGQKFSSKHVPPTCFFQNDLTRTFQLIVDTYGVPRYKEANPGLFTVISFPFFFGIMFGDIGHGLLLLALSIYLILFVDNKASMLNSVKYLLLMMSIFSIFCGFIYNDFFSVPFIAFDSCYMPSKNHGEPFTRRYDDCTYPIGVDWIWMQSSNETTFINSFKMKFSIIIGVIQMLFGLLLKGLNGFYFDNKIDFWFEALPQLIFMSVIFGYMCFCIIIKWLTNWAGRDPVAIIQLFINFTSVDKALYGTPKVQETIQLVFIAVAFASIFFMLVPKPLIINRRLKKYSHNMSIASDDSDPEQHHKLILPVS